MIICQHKQHAQGGEWRATNLVAMTARCALVTGRSRAQPSAAEHSRALPDKRIMIRWRRPSNHRTTAHTPPSSDAAMK